MVCEARLQEIIGNLKCAYEFLPYVYQAEDIRNEKDAEQKRDQACCTRCGGPPGCG